MPKFSVRLPKLRQARQHRLLTQHELADRAGVHRVTVAEIELGKGASSRTVRKLAEVLDVSPAELMDD
ncbi:MAG: helix-turn-helix transcriptional regulator [Chloroflexota bacterium]|nr:helix-turn-helix transcriptional regulator [Chloroflexota bacterium]